MFTEGGTHNARKVRQLAGVAVANGMSHEGALATMAITPSRVFGGASRVLDIGARADLVVWSGDPLEVTTRAVQVVMGGITDSMRSRQTLLRDRYLQANPSVPRAYINP